MVFRVLASRSGVLFSPVLLAFLAKMHPPPVTYTFGLERVANHGRITGIVDDDTINVLTWANNKSGSVSLLLMRQRKAGRSACEQSGHEQAGVR
jgi:hypothetical protein